MSNIEAAILEEAIGASREALLLVNLDQSEWPVVLANAAFSEVGGADALGRPVADVVESLVGRELALEVSESLRTRQETSYAVDIGGTDCLLVLKPLPLPGEERARHAALFFRSGAAARGDAAQAAQHALINARRRIRDLTRDDPVTGLLNERAFREVLEHDWAVASRERGTLVLVLFSLDDFGAYVDVFGRHAADSCLRRVGQAIRRCLRRASDVVARLDDARLIVLSHTSDEQAVREFATRIATTVRELGLHHPRSGVARFVTVSHQVVAAQAADAPDSAAAFLDGLLLVEPT
ncbi:MAG TPA: diguanylate cyclase [Woeseiaceae bacterium]|nr:diguanylate cyclase [Woeseiaceae bacterium]